MGAAWERIDGGNGVLKGLLGLLGLLFLGGDDSTGRRPARRRPASGG